jgi:hypothetical protein
MSVNFSTARNSPLLIRAMAWAASPIGRMRPILERVGVCTEVADSGTTFAIHICDACFQPFKSRTYTC